MGLGMQQRQVEGVPLVYHMDKTEGAPWVLLLHAAFVDHRMFRTQVEAFRGRYSVVAVDILGHGGSTEARRGDSLESMASWLNALLDAEGADVAHVVGVSLGGVLAQDFACAYPERVASLACFGAYDITRPDPELLKANGAAQMAMVGKALVSVRWFAGANKAISAYTDQAQQEFYELNLGFPKRSLRHLAALGKLVGKHEPRPRPYPLLIGCGEHDLPMELEAVQAWAAAEPGSSVVVVEGAGHCANMDAPDRFNDILSQFWTNGE